MTNGTAWSSLLGAMAGIVLAAGAGLAFAAPPVAAGFAEGTPRAAQEQSALTVTVRTCPAGYNPQAPEADFERDCREPAGDTLFRLQRSGSTAQGPSASTGTSGSAPQEATLGFSGLEPGRYTLTAGTPAEDGGGFVGRCASDRRSFDDYPFVPFAVVGPDGAVALTLVAGETLACDWYQIAIAAEDTASP